MISENIRNIRDRIAHACERIGRDPSEVTLIAVAKTFSSASIAEAAQAGVADIGENYVQEMNRKQQELSESAIRWHFIGHLQKNKVRSIIADVHMIHSVDSVALGQEISTRATEQGRTATVLIQVNTSHEGTKFGVEVRDARAVAERVMALPNIAVAGFMTIGPFLPDPEDSRPAFKELAGIRRAFATDGIFFPHLSMGMTNDFEIAVEEGATLVRVGTAIFGRREKKSLTH
jgi:pyridoxal phosphate enzyme (YggS family)